MKPQKFNLNKILVENRWLWHTGFWMFYFFMRLRPYYNTVLFYDKLFLKYMLLAEVLFFITTYFTLYLYNNLIPKKKFLIFFGLGFLNWILFVIGDVFIKKNILGSMPNIANYPKLDMFLDGFSYYILFYFFIILLKYFKQNFIFQYKQNQIIQQQMHFELENLKSQISPHFLFNTMNNFYGLAVDNSNKLPNLMIRLSDLLRYSLYETKQEKVPLENEIKYLENYIELEKIRLEENLKLNFNINNSNFEKFQIAPLLLITFLENAFKHSKNIQNESLIIEIFINVSNEGIMTFRIQNNFNSQAENNLVSNKGIGLENVQKRLEVIYPNENHLLKIEKFENFYKVELNLNLI
jgi:two-component system, LytTR family, sensor histidine kinase LytS